MVRPLFFKYMGLAIIALMMMMPVFGQGDPGCSPDCDPNAPVYNCSNIACQACPVCIPIDGGLGLLLAAGIGLGARRSFRKKKEGKPIN